MAWLPGSAQKTTWPAFVAATGINQDKIKSVTVDAASKLTVLREKKVDFIVTHVISKPQLEAQFPVKLGAMLYSDQGLDLVGYGIFTSTSVIEQKPDLVRRFVAATLKGWDYARQKPDEAIAAMKKYQSQAPNLVSGLISTFPLLDSKRTAGQPLGLQSKEDWQSTIDLLVKYADMKDAPAVDKVFTNDFLPK